MSRRRKKIPVDPAETVIESLSHEGRGVSRINGKTVFIDGALPGETVRFRYRRVHARYAEGCIEDVIANPSPDRVTASCPHFLDCGGCSLQHMSHDRQIAHKESVLREQLQHIGGVQAEEWLAPLLGPQWRYRHKARLGVKWVHKKDSVLVGFREKYSSYVADINTCEVLHPAVGHLLNDLSALIASLSIYDRVAQIEVAIDDKDTALVFRHLSPLGGDDVRKLQEFARLHGLRIYLQPAGPDSVQGLANEAHGDLVYHLDTGNVDIYFSPMHFTQVNSALNRLMVRRVVDLLAPVASDRVLDLFCGVGNFTLPIARYALAVTGIEGESALVEKARDNAIRNGLENTRFEAADLAGESWIQRCGSYEYNKVLLDPPRSGAQAVVENLDLSRVSRLVYVSCNPATLARDAGILVKQRGMSLRSAGIMDMFPHTTHVESMAVFENE